MKKIFYSIILLFLLKNSNASDLRERIYVQTDKHLYLAGEPVLMKFLTTNTDQIPIVFSKIAYTELVADSVGLIQIMVELTNGTGTGQMVLPADLPTGYYRLIAYTKFMRNEGHGVFFEKNIAVLNTFQSGYQPVETDHNLSNSAATDSDFGTILLQTNKTNYTTRERGELILTGLLDNLYTLSVSITGRDFVNNNETNISLFNRNLTKESIGFSGTYAPEYEGHILSGKIIDNETGTNAKETMASPGVAFPGEEIIFFAGQKNETGDVMFFTSGVSGSKEIATVVYDLDEQYRVDIISPFVSRFAPKQMPTLQIDSAYFSQLLERSVALQVFRYFSDEQSENQTIFESNLKITPSRAYRLDDYTRFTTMREVFVEFIDGARFRRNDGKQVMSVLTRRGSFLDYGTMPLVVLDGVPIVDHAAIFNYDPLSVEYINVYYGPFTLGGIRFDGIVELKTYRGLHQNLSLNRSSQVLSYEAPQSPYIFISNDYSDENNRRSRIPDGRHTLLWNTDVKTNGNTSFRMPFDTSDLIGEFHATIEGITKDGKMIYVTTYFKVE